MFFESQDQIPISEEQATEFENNSCLKVDDFFNFDSVDYMTFSRSEQVQLNNHRIREDEDQHFSHEDSHSRDAVVPTTVSQSEVPERKINKPKRVRKPCLIETKNITKFFGSRLYKFICSVLEQQKIHPKLQATDNNDLRLLKKHKCSTIKSLRQLWLQSENLKAISKIYFSSSLPVSEAMKSDRIESPFTAIKFIPSYLQGIENPNNFIKLKWDCK